MAPPWVAGPSADGKAARRRVADRARVSPSRLIRGARRVGISLGARLPPRLAGAVVRNPLFDAAWYRSTYPDIAATGVDPERHYRLHGVREGRDPNAIFRTRWYQETYPDVAAGRLGPLDHYHLQGWREGRDPGPGFCTEAYLDRYTDVRANGRDPLLHYLRHGHEEGRDPLGGRIGRREVPSGPAFRALLVSHDARAAGAQRVILNVGRSLVMDFGFGVETILLGAGPLDGDFAQLGRVHRLSDPDRDPAEERRLLEGIHASGCETAFVSTVVSGSLVAALADAGFRVVSLVHELPGVIRGLKMEERARTLAQRADVVVVPTRTVLAGLEEVAGPVAGRVVIRPQGLYSRPRPVADRDEARRALCRRLEVAPDARIVLAVGHADLRKGYDLFLQVAIRTLARSPDTVFVWVGWNDPAAHDWTLHDLRVLGIEDSVRLVPDVEDLEPFYAGTGILLLPSREDPFPSVVMEALARGIPAIAFADATGSAELLERGCGVVVPYLDVDAMAGAVADLLADPERRDALGRTGAGIVAAEHDWTDYVTELLALGGRKRRRVSVVVPSYDYAEYLAGRLESIYAQTVTPYEVIVLDDASTDGSLALLERLRSERGWDLRIVPNGMNSGSVIRQWQRGVEMARGDLVWIAEADDLADPGFLAALVGHFDDDAVVMAYSQSRSIDAEGTIITGDYLADLASIDPVRWTRSWVRPGSEELAESLAIRNTIANVSATLMDREALRAALDDLGDEIGDYRAAGDYAVYARLLTRGLLAFEAGPLNSHRLHERSVTSGSYGRRTIEEVARVQHEIRARVTVSPQVRAMADAHLRALCSVFRLPTELAATIAAEEEARREGAPGRAPGDPAG